MGERGDDEGHDRRTGEHRRRDLRKGRTRGPFRQPLGGDADERQAEPSDIHDDADLPEHDQAGNREGGKACPTERRARSGRRDPCGAHQGNERESDVNDAPQSVGSEYRSDRLHLPDLIDPERKDRRVDQRKRASQAAGLEREIGADARTPTRNIAASRTRGLRRAATLAIKASPPDPSTTAIAELTASASHCGVNRSADGVAAPYATSVEIASAKANARAGPAQSALRTRSSASVAATITGT